LKKFLHLLTLLVCLSAKILAQPFPYLNASTGNANEFIIDADSNIIMFHGNRVEKLDKNFNPIWINSYTGLTFKNLLMSKTGSLYFITKDATGKLGKIEANGNLSWCKALPTYTVLDNGSTQSVAITAASQLMLDRNNNLVVTGPAPMYLLKLDTSGTLLKLKTITSFVDPETSNIISDSAGVYTVSSWGACFECFGTTIYKYSDISDSIITYSDDMTGGSSSGAFMQEHGHILKSKNESRTFYLSFNTGSQWGIFPNTLSLLKVKNSIDIWRLSISSNLPNYLLFDGIEEDALKNTYMMITSYNVYTDDRDKWILKIDSMGQCTNQKYNYIHNFDRAPAPGFIGAPEDSVALLTRHYSNNFFYSIETSKVVPGPLHITKMDSTIGYLCKPTATLATFSDNYHPLTAYVTPTLKNAGSPAMQAESHAVTSLTNYSISVTSCIAAGVNENSILTGLYVYPNPAATEINLNLPENYRIEQLTIFDVNGKCVLTSYEQVTVDVSELNSSIYFIKVKTSHGEFSQKFIKE
jgi:hypothetical protein